MALAIVPDVASNTGFENELVVAKFTLRWVIWKVRMVTFG